jgi:alpha-beta hydrolase superfamily lysophospholipase
MNQIEVKGLRIAYERVGEGPPLVLLHGGLSDSREWRRQLEGLSDELTVVAGDAPGCGHLADPPETFRLPEYAEYLASLPDTFLCKRVMEEKRTHLGQGGEEENTRSSVQTKKLQMFGGRPQWMHLVYSG